MNERTVRFRLDSYQEHLFLRTNVIEFAHVDGSDRVFGIVAQQGSSHNAGQGCPRSCGALFAPTIEQYNVAGLDFLNEQIVGSLDARDTDPGPHFLRYAVSLVTGPFPPHRHRDGAHHETSTHLLQDLESYPTGRVHGGTGGRVLVSQR